MSNLDYNDLLELDETAPETKLVLHWEGDESSPEITTAANILDDYDAKEIDDYAYIMTLEDYAKEN